MKTYNAIEKEIDTLTEEELGYWNKGFITALYGFLDQLQDDQIKVLDKLVLIEGKEDKEKIRAILEARLVVLDAYEEHYRKRLNTLLGQLNGTL